MSLTTTDLISKARRLISDYPQVDNLGAALTSGGTTVTVADSSLYRKGWVISVDEEAMLITDLPSATTLTVVRGYKGTVAASHASAANVLVNPLGTGADYLDGLNEGIRYLWPHFFVHQVDTSIVIQNLVSDYALPAKFPTGRSRVSRVMVLYPGAPAISWYGYREFEVVRGDDIAAGDVIRFTNTPPLAGSQVKVIGIAAPDTQAGMTLTFGQTVPTSIPEVAFYCLPTYAAFYVLTGAEGQRDKTNRATNIGPAAVTPQANAQLAFSLLQKFQGMKAEQAMPWPASVTRRRF